MSFSRDRECSASIDGDDDVISLAGSSVSSWSRQDNTSDSCMANMKKEVELESGNYTRVPYGEMEDMQSVMEQMMVEMNIDSQQRQRKMEMETSRMQMEMSRRMRDMLSKLKQKYNTNQQLSPVSSRHESRACPVSLIPSPGDVHTPLIGNDHCALSDTLSMANDVTSLPLYVKLPPEKGSEQLKHEESINNQKYSLPVRQGSTSTYRPPQRVMPTRVAHFSDNVGTETGHDRYEGIPPPGFRYLGAECTPVIHHSTPGGAYADTVIPIQPPTPLSTYGND